MSSKSYAYHVEPQLMYNIDGINKFYMNENFNKY